MHKLSDFIKIDKRFQNSINLRLDLGSEEKISGYIPTRSSLVVLNEYLEHITQNRDKANILIGPYGKGKSHLLLVLLAMLGGQKQTLYSIVEKIKGVDQKTARQAQKLSGKKFLPVIVSGTYENLNTAFVAGISEALKREGMEEIVPDSYYTKACEIIYSWKENYKTTYQRLEIILKEKNLNVDRMLKGLEHGEKEKIELFEEIYPHLTSGSRFHPMVETEAVKLYGEINETIGQTKGYNGIYIVFDEFSKYVEGHPKDTFSRDMKILQDMCELSASTKKYQIHITFVAHKSIKEYGNALPREIINAFTGVEGRLKEERFIVSAGNNYELIKHVVLKDKKDFEDFLNRNHKYKEIITQSYKVPCFESSFSETDYRNIVEFGGFPLLPLASFCLLNISEKVAQNERSIFTFLANDEQGSLLNLLKKDCMFGADAIYDYFENLFRENKAMPDIHNEWLQADFALTKANTEEEKIILKVIALLRMIRKQDELPVIKKVIWMASGIEKEKFRQSIKALEQRGLIIFRPKMGVYAFKHNVGVDIEKEINQQIYSTNIKLNLCKEIGEVSQLDFVLPKQYNQMYTMTRFFRYVFMYPQQFLSIFKAEYLFEDYRADGLIICIVRDKDSSIDKIKKHLGRINDKRLVVIYPDGQFDQEKNLRKLSVVRKMLTDKEFTEDNQVLVSELKIYEEDLIFEINSFLEKSYMPENHQCSVLHENGILEVDTEKEFNRFLSKICGSYYNMAPKINSELINRNYVSAQIKKARQKIISNILEQADFSVYDKGTSPEATIFRAAMVHTGVIGKDRNLDKPDEGLVSVNREIERFIRNSAGKKVSFMELYMVLEGKNFGVRRGVIPIYLARELAAMEDTPVIYLNHKEVDITSEVFENINTRPKEYYLFVEQESLMKEEYLKRLEDIFVPDVSLNKNRLSVIVNGMQKWYRNLPQFTLNTTNAEKDSAYYRFRNLFGNMELNPRDILFDKIPEILCKSEQRADDRYRICADKIWEIVSYFNGFLEEQTKSVVTEIKELFGAKKTESLGPCLKGWYKALGESVKNRIWNDSTTGFINCIENLMINDESEIGAMLSKAVYGIYIEDWNDGSKEKFFTQLRNIKNQLEKVTEEKSSDGKNMFYFVDSNGNEVEKFYEPDTDDSTSYFLKNAIDDALEEFGETLETNQKLAVLVQTIEDLLKR